MSLCHGQVGSVGGRGVGVEQIGQHLTGGGGEENCSNLLRLRPSNGYHRRWRDGAASHADERGGHYVML